MFWAMRNLPVTEAVKHFLACGTTGSGKSVTIRLFLQSIAQRFRTDSDQYHFESPQQLVVFDAKCELVPLLAEMGLNVKDPEQNIWLLNPFDKRGAVWDLAEACQTPGLARALATLLVPLDKKEKTPFFTDSARELVCAVVIALNDLNKERGIKWNFRDLLCALDSPNNVRAVTSNYPPAARMAARFLDDIQHSTSILSTMASKLSRFEQVAALWHGSESGQSFSVTEFLKKPGVLILGNDPVLRDSIWPINALVLKTLTDHILRGSETRQPRHWFILDEFRAMEEVPCIHDLLNRGRSKGAAVLLGLQSVEGLIQVYKPEGTNDILSLCSHKTFLRAGGPQTAEWAEQHFGKVRQYEQSYSRSIGKEGHSRSVSTALHERPLFLASYFLDLPFPGNGNPYVAVCDVPSERETLIVRRDFDTVISWLQHPPQPNLKESKPEESKADDPTPKEPTPILAVEPQDDASKQTLFPWNPEEEAAFCQPFTTPGSRKEPGQSASPSAAGPSGPAPTKGRNNISAPEMNERLAEAMNPDQLEP